MLLLPTLGLGELPSLKRVDDPAWTTQYDDHFKKYAKHYFGPNIDWRWFKAQAIAESTLNPHAQGSSGSIGLMQIQPATFTAIQVQNPHFRNLTDPRWNIAAGIYLVRQMHRNWTEHLDPEAALPFAFGSYNAGLNAIQEAYMKTRKNGKAASHWQEAARFVPTHTRHYVKRIYWLMGKETASNNVSE